MFYGKSTRFCITMVAAWMVVQMGTASAGTDTPPQLAATNSRTPWGTPEHAWDQADGFGPVPERLRTRGDAACRMQGVGLIAVGHHAEAQYEGRPIVGGGFLCKPQGATLAAQSPAPRATLVDGVMGWDRPAVFGPVPQALLAKAVAACQKDDIRLQPIGYHARALDASGRLIPGGGFYCAPMVSAPSAAVAK